MIFGAVNYWKGGGRDIGKGREWEGGEKVHEGVGRSVR